MELIRLKSNHNKINQIENNQIRFQIDKIKLSS